MEEKELVPAIAQTDSTQSDDFEQPGWLIRLAQESWQAELIISGIAIVGSLQLPGLLETVLAEALYRFSEDTLTLIYFNSIYATFAIYGLIVNFILHFLMRTLWIAFIGLSSVYPHGIRREGLPESTYSEDYKDKILSDFPSVNRHIRSLDDQCSLLFAITASATIAFFNLLVVGLFATGTSALIANLTGMSPIVVAVVVTTLLLGPYMLIATLSYKPFRDKGLVKKYHYPLYKMVSRFIIPIGFTSYIYLLLTFLSNAGARKFYAGLVLYFLLIMLLSVTNLINSNAISMVDTVYLRGQTSNHRLYEENYEDLHTTDRVIMHPTLESDIISGKFLKVFVPFPARENHAIDAYCGTYEDDDNLDYRENREAGRAFRANCLRNYNRFILDTDTLNDYSLFLYDHPNHGEEGVKAYLPINDLSAGEHTLTIIKALPYEDNEKRTYQIPFFYED